MDEKLILQVLAEQKEYVENYQPSKWVDRNEGKRLRVYTIAVFSFVRTFAP